MMTMMGMHCIITILIRAQSLRGVIEGGGIRGGARVGQGGGVEGEIESEAGGARKQGS